ncbi:MAG TPA: LCP family protein [Streptosporangiaceae bacterium]
MARGRKAHRDGGWGDPVVLQGDEPVAFQDEDPAFLDWSEPPTVRVGRPPTRRERRAPARRPASRRSARRQAPRSRGGRVPVRGLWRALGLTVASMVVWGVAHVAAGRRLAGFSLMTLLALLVGGGATVAIGFQRSLMPIAVQRVWLDALTVGILALALLWSAIVIRSYQVVRPEGLPTAMRLTSGSLVVIMAVMVCAPLVYAANATYVLRNTLSDIFPGDDRSGAAVDKANPWKNLPRVNILLLGGDGGKDRTGIRTDSMTVASIDTKTGNTVLIGLPRALQRFPVPPRLRSRWPNGYTGDPGDQGLLNELYIIGERHPELVPGYRTGQRGPHLLEEVIGYLVGLKINYYALVNLAGFKDIVNAMGGVRVHVEKRLPIGGDPDRGIPPTGFIEPGWHKLNGENALWYGRSRHADDDFHRMDRQKCLMKDIADQADPQRVVTHVQKLAKAAKRTISTNIPADLLPALVDLSGTVKRGADIRSLPFDPAKIAGFRVYQPNILLMRQVTAKAIADSAKPKAAATGAAPTRKPVNRKPATRKPVRSGTAGTATPNPARTSVSAVSLKNVCG